MKYKIQISRVDRTRITEKGEYHCETAPTYEHIDGYTHWKKKNRWHRTGGPAIIYSSGAKEYWVEGVKVHTIY